MQTAQDTVVPDALFVDEPDFGDADPSTRDGFRVVYTKQVPFEMRIQAEDTPQEVGTLEAITCTVCVQGDSVAPTAVRLELSSEQDLFFHFTHTLDERAFRLVREEQRLMIEFPDYASVLARSLNQAIKEPHTHLAVFIQNRDGNARLDFIQVSAPRAGRASAATSSSLPSPPPYACSAGRACSCAATPLHPHSSRPLSYPPGPPWRAESRVQICGAAVRVLQPLLAGGAEGAH
jgi:hypothetical protein